MLYNILTNIDIHIIFVNKKEMGKTKKYYIEQNGFKEEQELRLESELLRQEEEYLYYKEYVLRNDKL